VHSIYVPQEFALWRLSLARSWKFIFSASGVAHSSFFTTVMYRRRPLTPLLVAGLTGIDYPSFPHHGILCGGFKQSDLIYVRNHQALCQVYTYFNPWSPTTSRTKSQWHITYISQYRTKVVIRLSDSSSPLISPEANQKEPVASLPNSSKPKQ